ncbi:MAG: PAAR domain-containing protein [Ferruginibacter sp.]
MGLPGARFGDMAGHGGIILIGAPTVLINGMMAARVGDPLVCPGFDGPKPHVLGNIIMGSVTVKIAGAFAARMGDSTGCGVAGVSGTSVPAVAGPPSPAPSVPGTIPDEQGQVVGKKNAGILFGKKSGFSNDEGAARTVQGSVVHSEGETKIGGTTFTGSTDTLGGTAEAHAGKGGFAPGGAGASAGVSGFSAKGKAANADGSSIAASGGVGNANVGGDILAGSDGRRTGFAMAGSAQASVVEGQVDTTSTKIAIPFTNSNVQFGTTVGGSAGSVGAAGQVGAFHDKADNRYHGTGMLDIELMLGAKLGFDISFGANDPPLPPPVSTPGIGVPMTPGVVMLGSPTVLIG